MTLEDARNELSIAAELLTETRQQYANGQVGQGALTLAENEYNIARSLVRQLMVD